MYVSYQAVCWEERGSKKQLLICFISLSILLQFLKKMAVEFKHRCSISFIFLFNLSTCLFLPVHAVGNNTRFHKCKKKKRYNKLNFYFISSSSSKTRFAHTVAGAMRPTISFNRNEYPIYQFSLMTPIFLQILNHRKSKSTTF